MKQSKNIMILMKQYELYLDNDLVHRVTLNLSNATKFLSLTIYATRVMNHDCDFNLCFRINNVLLSCNQTMEITSEMEEKR